MTDSDISSPSHQLRSFEQGVENMSDGYASTYFLKFIINRQFRIP